MEDVIGIGSKELLSSKQMKVKLVGPWKDFYDKHDTVFSESRIDSGVQHLLFHLQENDFPMVPSNLDYDEDSQYSRHFTLFWTGHFFVQIPFIDVTSPVTIVSTAGGPFIKFETVDKVGNHLIDNVIYYQKSDKK